VLPIFPSLRYFNLRPYNRNATDISVSVVGTSGITMKNYILTEREKTILKKFLETGQKQQGFRGLKFRIIQGHKKLNQDFTLIDLAFQKFRNG
jgi:hypothetical protein